MRQSGIYIMGNRADGPLYIGVSGHLKARIHQHRTGRGSRFCHKYNLTKCVYYEMWDTAPQAIEREKRLKAGSRQDKINLIAKVSPNWEDIYATIP